MSVNILNKMWLSWTEINKIQEKRKIIFFGRGEWMDKSIPYLAKSAIFVVDNNKYEQGQQEQSLDIFMPGILNQENKDDIFIIITTTSFIAVEQQLIEYGFQPGVHFCISPSLKNFQVVSSIHHHNQIVHFTCSDQAHQGGGLYSYNIQTREKIKLIEGVCHGIVQSGENIFMVDDMLGVRVMNLDLETIKVINLPIKSRPHGIAYCQKRNIMFVNFSGKDAIGMYDLESGDIIDEIQISNKFVKTGVPQHHINDSCVHGNYLYVSMFSFSGNWKIGMYDGGILQYDVDTKEYMGVVASDLWMPHTPVVINGLLHYCDSMRSVVADSSWRTMTKLNGFIRGIAYDGYYYYIGQSAHRYIDRLEGTTSNISLDTGFHLIDRINKVSKFFSIPEVTDINSVIVIN